MTGKVTPLEELTIPSAGTAVQATSIAFQAISISFEADRLNTGKIYIGLIDVDENKYITALQKGDQININTGIISGNNEVFIVSDYWIDTETDNNTVHISYQSRR